MILEAIREAALQAGEIMRNAHNSNDADQVKSGHSNFEGSSAVAAASAGVAREVYLPGELFDFSM